MSKKKKSSVYATVTADEGVNYREIADMMTEIGFKMNHSSARNHVLRVMRKFAEAITEGWDIKVTPEKMEDIVKSSHFQKAIGSLLQKTEINI